MDKKEQILIIEPQHELKFRGPFTTMVVSHLILKNPTESRVCFKIKTTAPKKYCVRPNSGIIFPKDQLEIAVCLQPFEFDPNEKNKHKFMVQTMIVPADYADTMIEPLWKEANPENLMDTKLKCVFEMPVDLNATEHNLVDVVTTNEMANLTDSELIKAAKEVKHLREEESNLRQENIKLQEELLSLKKQLDLYQRAGDRLDSSMRQYGSFRPQNQSDGSSYSLMFPSIVVALVMALVGVVIGKFIL